MYRTMCASAMVFVVAASLAVAQPGTGSEPVRRPSRMREAFVEKLHLTDQQKAQMKSLRSELQKSRVQNEAKIRLARIDLRDLFLADKLDRAAIEKRIKEITDLQYEAKMIFLNHLFAVNALLTPEQQKIWKEQMSRMAPEMQNRLMRFRGHNGMRGPLGQGPDGQGPEEEMAPMLGEEM